MFEDQSYFSATWCHEGSVKDHLGERELPVVGKDLERSADFRLRSLDFLWGLFFGFGKLTVSYSVEI